MIYAHALRKPVAIFAGEDVQIGGLIAKDERYQNFSRNKTTLLTQVPYFNKFLMALYVKLEEDFRDSLVDTSPLFARRSIVSRDEMIDRECFLTRCEVELECLEDGLARCDEGFGDIDWLRSPTEAIKEFESSQLQGPVGVTTTYQLGRSKEDPNSWSMIFDPPLKIGQRLTYAFSYKAEHIRPYTLEEALQAIDRGEYWSDHPQCAISWEIDAPTKELVCEVVFPPKYPIHEPGCVVEAVMSGTQISAEMKRIEQAGGFKVEKHWFRYRLILTVADPIRGYRYLVSWTPPSMSELA